MIISAVLVKRPRKTHYCGSCDKVILENGVKLFGAACYGDKPYQMYIHLHCASNDALKILMRKYGSIQGNP